jgi:hypothetical protein
VTSSLKNNDWIKRTRQRQTKLVMDQPKIFQNANLANGMRKRVCQYLAPVLVFSILFNLPKFFESEIDYTPTDARNDTNVSSLPMIETKFTLTKNK